MKIYFNTRSNARAFSTGKLFDEGSMADKGKRFARSFDKTANSVPAWKDKPVFKRGRQYSVN